MNQVEVLDNGVVLNGNLLTFPLSYEDIRALFGEARINVQSDNNIFSTLSNKSNKNIDKAIDILQQEMLVEIIKI